MTFSTFDLDGRLLRGLEDLGFSEPTPIQSKGLPPALEGRDVLGCAMTGSGKTAAFLLPILQRLLDKRRGTTRALVVAPTRELAAQIVANCNDLARHARISAAAVYGGVGMGPQERALRNGVDVIVACPGRLLDHMSRSYVDFSGLEVLVLDEADRMLDMGFLPDIRRVLRELPARKQTMLFSATMPRPIVQLADELLRSPAKLDIERPSAPAAGVEQAIYPVHGELKTKLIRALLERNEISNALVFTRTKHRANRLAQVLNRHGVASERIHGNRSQNQRTQALAGFKKGRYRVLVATDVAARGIDIEALSHVVNFDVPNMPEDYIHRVGRTARAGATGEAFTFVAPQEERDLKAIERAVGKRLPRRTLEGFDYAARAEERFEVPIGERIAEIRARKAKERQRAKEKERARAAAKARQEAGRKAKPNGSPAQHRGQAGGGNGRGNGGNGGNLGIGGRPGGAPGSRPGGRRRRRRRPQAASC